MFCYCTIEYGGCQSYDDEKCCEFMDENISKESENGAHYMRKVCKKERKIVENASYISGLSFFLIIILYNPYRTCNYMRF